MPYFTHIRYKEDLDRGGKPYTIRGNLIELGDSKYFSYFVYLENLVIPFIDKPPSLDTLFGFITTLMALFNTTIQM